MDFSSHSIAFRLFFACILSRAVPPAVFSQPPIGQVGLTEELATLSGLPDWVFMKLIACAKTNKVLGLHMCGEDSAEILQGFAAAIKAGLTKADLMPR
ncbi:hypothetical protein J1N35_011991 [Gossypium stocksii]|uniref:Pyridine nucleotide-disulphide oxidoreductase dimerisation domain-containing protein n=1 Tax=Gossypium stocksii TaxID=47602 RepID=A0A9D4ADW9_9ROSI|nr:hypothetical protein J1N35_011991 [Gossypium stocksii]